MKDLICDEFQNAVSELLIRHHSVLDVLSKFQESCARTNRATIKAVTGVAASVSKPKTRYSTGHLTSGNQRILWKPPQR